MKTNGEIAKIMINGKELKPCTDISFTCTLSSGFDNEKFNELFETLSKIDKQQKLKERLFSKFLFKLIRKEINQIVFPKRIIMLHPYEENQLIIFDRSKWITKLDEFIPLSIKEDIKNDSVNT